MQLQRHPHPHPGLGALGSIPPEILQRILFLLVAHTPLGPPSALVPVHLASRALHAAASTPALLAQVFRLKFDAGAVERRLFVPQPRDLVAQLEWACRVLKSLKRGLPATGPGEDGGTGVEERVMEGSEDYGRDTSSQVEQRSGEDADTDMCPEQTLLGVLLLMADNDGRNYAQLEHAGVHAYVADFVSQRLWDGSRENAGWPIEDASSACALWVMWMTTDRERLMKETPLQRERVVLSILPFVFLLHRYPASEAPPNHFHLPLLDPSAAASGPLPHAPRTAFYPELTEGFGSHGARMEPDETYDDEDAVHEVIADEDAVPNAQRRSPPTNSPSHHAHPPTTPSPPPSIPQPQHYPHYLPPRFLIIPYFGALPSLAPPLASTAAKLLFVARREVRPFDVPLHLPRDREEAVRVWWMGQVEGMRTQALAMQQQGQQQAQTQGQGPAQLQQVQHPIPIPPMPAHIRPPDNLGPTQADYRALNRGKAATLPRGARWDWEEGCARAVNREDGLDADGLGGDASGGKVEVMRKGKGRRNGDGDEESRKWDTLWWRMRLCGNFTARQPRFAPGAVFERGCMKGMWQGKIYIPHGNSLMQLIGQNPAYPGLPDMHGFFSEASLGVVMQPVFLEMQEHVRVCGCAAPATAGIHPRTTPRRTKRKRARRGSDVELEVDDEEDGQSHERRQACGVIPVPPPSGIADWRRVPFAGVLPAELPAGHPQHGPPPPLPIANANANDPQFDSVREAHALVLPPQPLDYSMSNAWLPGGIGDLAFESRVASGGAPLVVRKKGGLVHVDADEEEKLRRRDELVVSTTGRPPDLLRAAGTCQAFKLHPDAADVTPEAVPEECYVYETYDPNQVSVHDVRPESAPYQGPSRRWVADDGVGVGVVELEEGEEGKETVNPHCAKCAEREAARRVERAKEERKARRALEKRAKEVSAVDADARAATLSDTPRVSPECSSPGKREIDMEGHAAGRESKRRRVGDSERGQDESDPTLAKEAQRQLEEMMRHCGRRADDGHVDLDLDVEMEGAVEELDVDGFGLRMKDEDAEEDEDEDERRDLEDEDENENDETSDEEEEDTSALDDDDIFVLGDDFPCGQPGIWTSTPTTSTPSTSERTYIPRTRREFSRARITSIRTPCAHAADTLFTGHTPACGLAWGQRYVTYGRLRPWDGLVGLVRVGRNPVNFIFIFGYVVGGRTFVGEWRVAASDPMRPACGGPFAMSRVEA